MLRALGRERRGLVPSHTARVTVATHSVEKRGQEQSALTQYPRVAQQRVWASTNGEEAHRGGELPLTLGRDERWGTEIPNAAVTKTDAAAAPSDLATPRISHPFARCASVAVIM